MFSSVPPKTDMNHWYVCKTFVKETPGQPDPEEAGGNQPGDNEEQQPSTSPGINEGRQPSGAEEQLEPPQTAIMEVDSTEEDAEPDKDVSMKTSDDATDKTARGHITRKAASKKAIMAARAAKDSIKKKSKRKAADPEAKGANRKKAPPKASKKKAADPEAKEANRKKAPPKESKKKAPPKASKRKAADPKESKRKAADPKESNPKEPTERRHLL